MNTYPFRKESRMILESDILAESFCLITQNNLPDQLFPKIMRRFVGRK